MNIIKPVIDSISDLFKLYSFMLVPDIILGIGPRSAAKKVFFWLPRAVISSSHHQSNGHPRRGAVIVLGVDRIHMKGWSVNYPLAILQSQNSDVVMMLNESICMQCSGTFSVAARCDRPQPAGKRGGSMILSIGFRCEISRLNSTRPSNHPSYHTPNLAHTSPIPYRLSPFCLLLQFFVFLLFSLFGSFSLFQSLACILEGS